MLFSISVLTSYLSTDLGECHIEVICKATCVPPQRERNVMKRNPLFSRRLGVAVALLALAGAQFIA
jgi:hypothetical protein